MSETEPSVPLERRQACDNCKARKTKCDRRSPCASCVTLNVACRTTRRAPEKRQRVLLSSKYDEAVQDVGRQLSDVKEMLQRLLISKDITPAPKETLTEQTHNTPPAMIDEQVPSLSTVREGYNGDPSFQSHAHRIKNALETALATSELINVEALGAPTAISPQGVAELLHDADPPDHAVSDRGPHTPPQPTYGTELGNLPLPPIDLVLKILRLAKVHKQQFFVDFPIFKEDEFIEICRGVYFATEPISLWTWICVNIGLYYLFFGVDEGECRRMGTTVEAIRSHGKLLKENIETAMQSLRLCSEPSTESCRALSLLGTFYLKDGHNTIAWRLISAAARACLDLGFHRLSDNLDSEDTRRKSSIFWHIYTWEKGLAMTSGRTPIIHHYDVTTPHPATLAEYINAPRRVYGAILDYAIITGEIQQKLFSASARNLPHETRLHHVRELASRLKAIQDSVVATRQDPSWDKMYGGAAGLLNIIMHSLLTIVYRILPPNSVQPHPLQCSVECIDAARKALSRFVQLGEERLKDDLVGWTMLLNVILSLAPFVPFIVLAGNAIATSSNADLALLSSSVSVLGQGAADSPSTQKIHDACERLGRVATLIVSSANESSSLKAAEFQGQASNNGFPLDNPNEDPSIYNGGRPISEDYGFPMAQQDWDSVMIGFESELGSYGSRELTNIIEPYIANTGW
ncbi:uncharacterized protein F4822DRAFT_384294 [Hypoxylon trugodes]|uniref:uncharacterized protein n=1 Tax=Hypoxylon trugodes TaxID=326681 RepID=UPI002198516B|nr:uncharacterized protein F4822DRAFT_384294 [Hypoxylon trugodes]KAI1393318.1 hypothetical protein F4822DRAFT_384294 [Hypoxylon trugodes]